MIRYKANLTNTHQLSSSRGQASGCKTMYKISAFLLNLTQIFLLSSLFFALPLLHQSENTGYATRYTCTLRVYIKRMMKELKIREFDISFKKSYQNFDKDKMCNNYITVFLIAKLVILLSFIAFFRNINLSL